MPRWPGGGVGRGRGRTLACVPGTERTWIRFGELPTAINPQDWEAEPLWNLRSRNHATGGFEFGVSVYEGCVDSSGGAWLDLSKVDAGSALFIADFGDIWQITARQMTADDYYRATRDPYSGGVRLAAPPTGSDGEPLVWIHCDDRHKSQRRVRVTALHVRIADDGEWIDCTPG